MASYFAIQVRCSVSLAAVLFDVDGTLADTESTGHRAAYNLAFAALGLDWFWSPQLYQELLPVSGGISRLSFFVGSYGPSLGAHEPAYRADPDAWIAALHRHKAKFFQHQLAAGEVLLRPGVARLVAATVAAGIPIGLVSNASRATVDDVRRYCLESVLGDVVAVTVAGDDVTEAKPDPLPYTLACRQLGVAPSDALVIEDSPTGLSSARAAGLATLITTNEETRGRLFPGALAVVDSLDAPGYSLVAGGNRCGAFDYVSLDVLRALQADWAAS